MSNERKQEGAFFLYLPLTPTEEAELKAMSVEERGKRRRAWVQAQNVLWLCQMRRRKE